MAEQTGQRSTWRSRLSREGRKTAAETATGGDDASEAASEVSQGLKQSLSEVQVSLSTLKGQSPHIVAARSALETDRAALMHKLTGLKPLAEQLKTLEQAMERKRESHSHALAAVSAAEASLSKISTDMTGLSNQIAKVKSEIATQQAEQAEQARVAAANAAANATANQTARASAGVGMRVDSAPPTVQHNLPSGPYGNSPLCGNHIQFLLGLAQLLPAPQAYNFCECMNLMSPGLQAAGVTPVPLAMPMTTHDAGISSTVPMTPETHIQAGGPPNGVEPRDGISIGTVPATTDLPVPAEAHEGRMGRTLRAHPSEESAVSRGSRAGSRRRMRSKTVDPYLGRSPSPLWAAGERMHDG